MLNNVTLVGRLTKDVDLRYTANGKAVGNFTLAVNRAFKDANGETQADFIPVVVWGKPAENTANYMKKGSMVGVVGRIQTRHYDNNDGQRVYVTEVVTNEVSFLESRNSNQGGQSQGGNQQAPQQGGYQQQPQGGQAPQQNQQQAPQQQGNYQQQQGNYQQQGGQQNMQPIDISDDDLPF